MSQLKDAGDTIVDNEVMSLMCSKMMSSVSCDFEADGLEAYFCRLPMSSSSCSSVTSAIDVDERLSVATDNDDVELDVNLCPPFSDDEDRVAGEHIKSSISDNSLDADQMPTTERPPSSAGSEDSGFGGCSHGNCSIDLISSDDDENGSGTRHEFEKCDTMTSWTATSICRCVRVDDSMTSSSNPLKRRHVVSVLQPPTIDSCRSDSVVSVDLTGRTDVTYTVEALHPLPVVQSVPRQQSDVAVTTGQLAVVQEKQSRFNYNRNESSGHDDVVDVNVDCVQSSTPSQRSDDPLAGHFTSVNSGTENSQESGRRHRRRMYLGFSAIRPWTLTPLMPPLVPGFLIVPPPVNYIVLKPVNGTPIPGEFYVMQGCAPVDARPVVGLLPVVNGVGYNLDDSQRPRYAGTRLSSSRLRKWMTIEKPTFSGPRVSIRAMTYNVLAKKMATVERFPYCTERMLSWEHRKALLLSEIVMRNADVIALQEVELREYIYFFQPQLEMHGYNGVFALKSRARTMSSDKQLDVDGCAIFYRTAKFTVVSSHVIEFNSLALHVAVDSDLSQNHDFLHRVLSKDNVGLAVLLQTTPEAWSNGGNSIDTSKIKPEPILIATAHLFWDPDCPDVKLIQTMFLTQELQRIAAATPPHLKSTSPSSENGGLPPLILVGDFNALPDSGVISYLRDGYVSSTHSDFCGRDYTPCLKTINGSGSGSTTNNDDVKTSENDVTYRHNLRLNQVDCHVNYTNYTSWFRGIIDHVFYTSESNIRPIRTLRGLSSDWLRDFGVIGLPTVDIPSDHVPLLVDFRLIARTT